MLEASPEQLKLMGSLFPLLKHCPRLFLYSQSFQADGREKVRAWNNELHWKEHFDNGDGQTCTSDLARLRSGLGVREGRMDGHYFLVREADGYDRTFPPQRSCSGELGGINKVCNRH